MFSCSPRLDLQRTSLSMALSSILLPISIAFEDTLRLLINTALLDRVFGEGTSSWNDLSQIWLPSHIAETGRRIQLKGKLMDVPVLRRMIPHNLTKDPSRELTSRHKSPDFGSGVVSKRNLLGTACVVVMILCRLTSQSTNLYLNKMTPTYVNDSSIVRPPSSSIFIQRFHQC
jgi:hypothetical protein